MLKQLFLFLTIVVVLGGCSIAPQQSVQVAAGQAAVAQPARLLGGDGDTPKAGDVAPDFQFTMPDGSTTKLSQLHGKKVILNFWATWCGPCQMEMPALEQAHQQQGSTLIVLGMNREGVGEEPTLDAIKSFTKDVKVTFPILLDLDSTIADRYGVHNLPMSFFINTDGTIGNVHLGGMDYEFISQQVDQLK